MTCRASSAPWRSSQQTVQQVQARHLFAWQELRRGADPARVFSIAFAKGDAPEWLAMSSDKVRQSCFTVACKVDAPV